VQIINEKHARVGNEAKERKERREMEGILLIDSTVTPWGN
jgi:hypothetical protein